MSFKKKAEKLLESVDGGDNSDNEEKVKTKKKKGGDGSGKKSGGFQSMALSYNVLKGVLKRGYKVPTPIQRKTIPLAMIGKDVVAMARTGSGKTACFLIPLLEKLKARQAKAGARALILSPTRELALQTLKFIKDLGKFTGLKPAVILGGDSMEMQFSAIHGNPDIIVATPGRFLHICVEMEMNLKSIEFVVFDEADRLFEMGFGEQINEISSRLPDKKQVLLFSATLPKVLVEFAKVGLTNPVLVRLDVESKLPEELKLNFITCRPEEKLAVMLCLLKQVINLDSQTVIFAATMHHVEYISLILTNAGIPNTLIYSNLDATARKINAAKFQHRKVNVLVVTDVAARGIDIPHLDNVINFNFPAKSKLFVHRVGRCARAGRSGTAYNIVSPDEYAHLLDLHLFLDRPFNIVPSTGAKDIPEGSVGKMPQSMIEEELSNLVSWHENNTDIFNMQNVCENAYQKYMKSRPAASVESIKRIKEMDISVAGVLPEFKDLCQDATDILSQMKSYRPRGTVFEIVAKPSSVDYKVMKEKRAFHKENIRNHHRKIEERQNLTTEVAGNKETSKLPSSSNDEINTAFSEVIVPKKRKLDDIYRNEKRKKQKKLKDDEFYIPYVAPDHHTEDGLAVNNFASEADKARLDLCADNDDSRRLQSQIKRWDRKKKKMITIDNKSRVGKIRSESGAWIPATYKTKRYEQWKEKNKVESQLEAYNNDEDYDNETHRQLDKLNTTSMTRWGRHNQKVKEKESKKIKSELKRPEQVLKAREIAERKRARNGRKKGSGRGKGRGRRK